MFIFKKNHNAMIKEKNFIFRTLKVVGKEVLKKLKHGNKNNKNNDLFKMLCIKQISD